MAVINVNINSSDVSIAQFNELTNTSNRYEMVKALEVILSKLNHGDIAATLIVTTRDTNPTVATSGSGSTQTTLS